MVKRKLHIGFFIVAITCASFSSAQVINAPYLHCVSVQNNGNIQLDWTQPVNSCGPCSGYTIYWSNNINGPYTPISVPFGTSYVHVVPNGGSATYYYYMESDCNCPGATVLQSDTLDNLDPVTPQINYV